MVAVLRIVEKFIFFRCTYSPDGVLTYFITMPGLNESLSASNIGFLLKLHSKMWNLSHKQLWNFRIQLGALQRIEPATAYAKP